MTLHDWLQDWLELYVDPSALAENTKRCYHRAVRAVPDALGVQPLSELSPLDLRRWLLQVAQSTPRAAQLDRVMLSRSLTVAAKLGLCRAGMVDGDVCPKIVHKPRKTDVLSAEQLRDYMAAAAATPCAPVLMLCCCGLRRGEAMGARWENVDLKAGTLAIVGQRQTHELMPLKSEASRRVIALPPKVIELLRKMPRHISGWICDVSQTTVYKSHMAALDAAGLPHVTLHALRHSMATICAMKGEPIKLIQAALGHSHYSLTADLYADHLPPVAAVTGRFLAV